MQNSNFLKQSSVVTAADELELLRTALLRDRTLFTVQRNASRSNDDSIRVDCFASKEAGSPGLMRITDLVAGVLKYRITPRGLTINNKEDVDLHLVAALSKKLGLDLKHERVR